MTKMQKITEDSYQPFTECVTRIKLELIVHPCTLYKMNAIREIYCCFWCWSNKASDWWDCCESRLQFHLIHGQENILSAASVCVSSGLPKWLRNYSLAYLTELGIGGSGQFRYRYFNEIIVFWSVFFQHFQDKFLYFYVILCCVYLIVKFQNIFFGFVSFWSVQSSSSSSIFERFSCRQSYHTANNQSSRPFQPIIHDLECHFKNETITYFWHFFSPPPPRKCL